MLLEKTDRESKDFVSCEIRRLLCGRGSRLAAVRRAENAVRHKTTCNKFHTHLLGETGGTGASAIVHTSWERQKERVQVRLCRGLLGRDRAEDSWCCSCPCSLEPAGVLDLADIVSYFLMI